MDVGSMKLDLQYRPIAELKKNPRNPRKHGKKQLDKLSAKMKEIGFLVPIMIDENDRIIAGHGRLEAAKQAGMSEVPTIRAGHLTDEQKRAFIIFDNKIAEDAEWDEAMLREEMNSLINEVEADIETTGFTMTEAASVDPLIVPSDVAELKEVGREDSGAVEITIINPSIFFGSNNSLGIPDLRPDMMGDIVPTGPWNRRDPDARPPGECILTWGEHRREICTPKRTDGATLCFYEFDEAFEGIWTDPAKAIDRMKEYNWGQVVCPDFTADRAQPIALQIYALYRTQWMGRFFQENGFKIIPTIEMLDERAFDFQWAGIPKNCPLLCCQTRTFFGTKTTMQSHQERRAFFLCLEETIKRLSPKGIIFYGGDKNEGDIRPHLPKGTDYHFLGDISTLHSNIKMKGARY